MHSIFKIKLFYEKVFARGPFIGIINKQKTEFKIFL